MSAVVAILNRQAVAIAADSAVTVNGKIYNNALKIFTLSKYHPVGVMIYNSGSFLSTPWETIIKIYRAQLKSTSFSTVKQYKEDFIKYLHDKKFFVSDEEQKQYLLSNLFYFLYNSIHEEVLKQKGAVLPEGINQECDRLIALVNGNPIICEEFKDFTFENFNDFLGETFNQSIEYYYAQRGTDLEAATTDKLKILIHGLIIKQEQFTYFTGLVFVGFGEDEIFPALSSMNVHFAIQSRLKHYDGNEVSISYNWGSSIQPFAQTAAMNTLLTGIAPTLGQTYTENFKQFLTKYNQRLFDIINPSNPEIADQIKAIDIDQQVRDFDDDVSQVQRTQYTGPLMGAVESLSKEDLSEMAESWVHFKLSQLSGSL